MAAMFPKMVAHNRESVPGCVLRDAQLCAGRLGCVEGHPWTHPEHFMKICPFLSSNNANRQQSPPPTPNPRPSPSHPNPVYEFL